jgi:hypothetical protein
LSPDVVRSHWFPRLACHLPAAEPPPVLAAHLYRGAARRADTPGQDRLGHLRIDADAASYIGLSGEISLQVHAMRMLAADPAPAAALRHLDSGTAAVLIIGTRGVAGYAVVGADRVTGRPGRSSLPPAVIHDARRMLGSRQTACRIYDRGQPNSTGIRVWMTSYPQA